MTWTPKPEYRLADAGSVSREDIDRLCGWLANDESEIPAPAPGRAVPWLTQGPLVAEFERQFAAKVGAKHAIFVNSGSSANLLAWYFPRAFDWFIPEAERTFLPNGDPDQEPNLRVVVPAVAWSTSVMPAIQFGYSPVLCEADEETWGLDPKDLRRICESEKGPPSIVFLVHVLGVPAKMKEIDALRKEFGFLLIEDACGAFGSQPVGKVGEIWTYSTYFAHQLSTIEGGFVCTNGDGGANILRMMRAHGWAVDCDADTRARLAKDAGVEPFRERFTFFVPGFNVRGTDLAAHIGLSQMKRADEVGAARKRSHKLYVERFAGSKAFTIQTPQAGAEVSSIGFGALASSKVHRARVAEALKSKGVETRPIGGGNMARQPFFPKSKRERPVADAIHDRGFQLPNNQSLAAEDVNYIADVVLSVRP